MIRGITNKLHRVVLYSPCPLLILLLPKAGLIFAMKSFKMSTKTKQRLFPGISFHYCIILVIDIDVWHFLV